MSHYQALQAENAALKAQVEQMREAIKSMEKDAGVIYRIAYHGFDGDPETDTDSMMGNFADSIRETAQAALEGK